MKKEIKTSAYTHVHNGGPSLTLTSIIEREDEGDKFAHTRISLEASYYGYPDVMASLSLRGHSEIETLEKMRDAISEHIFKLKTFYVE